MRMATPTTSEPARRHDEALARTAEFRAEEALAAGEAEPGAGPDDDSTHEGVIGEEAD